MDSNIEQETGDSSPPDHESGTTSADHQDSGDCGVLRYYPEENHHPPDSATDGPLEVGVMNGQAQQSDKNHADGVDSTEDSAAKSKTDSEVRTWKLTRNRFGRSKWGHRGALS